MKKLRNVFAIIILLAFSLQTGFANTKVKVALILDTSNSMDGLIDQAKSQLWNIVNELSRCKYDAKKPDLEIALYEYGNDKLPMREGYIRQVTIFTSDLDLLSEKLFGLRTLGGSEYCGQVIGTSLTQLDWGENKNNLKMIFIAGNEPFDQGNVSYREVCKTAREKDIVVNTIFCGSFNEGVNTHWKDGAYIGGGDYMNIDQDCKYVYKPTPYDDRIYKLNEELNKTYIPYGKKGNSYKFRQADQDMSAEGLNQESGIQRAISKSSDSYSNVQWDLVDAYEEDNKVVTTLNDSELPKEMKGLTAEQRKTFVEEKMMERKKIQTEINTLNGSREKFLAENQDINQSDNLLDKVIVQSVKKQAEARNYTFD